MSSDVDSVQSTPMCCKCGHLELVKYLMPKFGDGKFDLECAAHNCLHNAVCRGYPKLVRYLIEERGFNPCLKDSVSNIIASERASLYCLKCLLVQADLDCSLLACSNGRLAVVQELMTRHRVNPHLVNEVCVCVCVC